MRKITKVLAVLAIACLWLALLPTLPTIISQPAQAQELTGSDAPEFGPGPLLEPPSGATITSSRPTLIWSPPITGQAVSYTVRLTGPQGMSDYVSQTPQFTPTLSVNGIYSWTVRAYTAGQASTFVTPAHTFTLSTTWPIDLPEFGPDPLQEPPSGATITSSRPTLIWSPPITGQAVSYTVRLTGPQGMQDYVSQTPQFTPTLAVNGLYSWTVRAYTAGQASTFVTPTYTFTLSTTWPIDLPEFGPDPLQEPPSGATITSSRPTLIWSPPISGQAVSYTVRLTGPQGMQDYVSQTPQFTPTLTDYGIYSWTVRAHNAAGQSSAFVTPTYTFTLNAAWSSVYLPLVTKSQSCPATSNQSYTTLLFSGSAADRPGPEHADLNLELRGYSETIASKVLVQYSGATDSNAPQLDGLFEPNNYPGISAVYRVNNWIWQNYPNPGYRGSPIDEWAVTLLKLPAAFGTPLYLPERGPEIYGGGYKALVLYAEANRLTLGYTRDDSVASGYAVHLEGICVDPNLLALYNNQTDAAGRHVTGHLPALKNNQRLGTAFVDGVKVAIRDKGAFMDPRSRKDWWNSINDPAGLEIRKFHATSSK